MVRKILDLPLKKEWYNMINSGVKTLENYFKDFPERAKYEEYAIVKCYRLID
jgi:hypothetical protein